MAAVALDPVPQSPEGFYAINNPFLVSGTKDFKEMKMLENKDIFARVDFPGVPKEGVMVFLDPAKKALNVYAEAPMVHKHDSSHRDYLLVTQIALDSCAFSGFTSQMSDGVLRLHLSTTDPLINPRYCTGLAKFPDDLTSPDVIYMGRGSDPALTGPVLKPNPLVVHGSALAYESKQLENGSLYLRLDMPGVPKENFAVSVSNGRVKVTGLAPAVGHDSAGRFYSGDVAMLSAPVDIPSRRVKTIAKDGVIRLLIPPL